MNSIGYEKAHQKERRSRKGYGLMVKKTTLKRIASALGIIMILLASVYLAYARELHAFAARLMHVEAEALPEGAEKKVTNILLIGTDAREAADTARADAIILLSIIPQTDTITLTSFLRDTCVATPDFGEMKLTDLYAVAGPQYVVDSLEQMYDISISDYACVDLCNAWRVLDLMGGAEVELQLAEAQQMNGLIYELNTVSGEPYGSSYMSETEEGKTLLDGKQAVAYGRIRYSDSDIVRTSRQRNVIKGVIKHWCSLATHFKIGELVRIYKRLPEAAAYIRTTLTADEFENMLELKKILRYSSYTVQMKSIPMEGTWSDRVLENGQMVVSVDNVKKNADWLEWNTR